MHQFCKYVLMYGDKKSTRNSNLILNIQFFFNVKIYKSVLFFLFFKSESPAGISRQPSTKGSRQRAKPRGEGNQEDDIFPIKYAGGFLSCNRIKS